MNDKFKFRAWNKLSNIMSYEVCFGNFFQHSQTEKKAFDWISVSYGDNFISHKGDALKEIVLMQCTGLKDKNGKLIYESDIVKLDDGLYCVAEFHKKYDMDYGRVEFILLGSHPKCPTIYIPTVAKESEVVGNIYENPELLKECE